MKSARWPKSAHSPILMQCLLCARHHAYHCGSFGGNQTEPLASGAYMALGEKDRISHTLANVQCPTLTGRCRGLEDKGPEALPWSRSERPCQGLDAPDQDGRERSSWKKQIACGAKGHPVPKTCPERTEVDCREAVGRLSREERRDRI